MEHPAVAEIMRTAAKCRGGLAFALKTGILCGGLAASCAAYAQSSEAWHSQLGPFVDGLVTTVLDRDAVAGAVVTVVTGNEILLSRGYRLADAGTGRMMDPLKDIIPLASVTKVFTAFTVLQLVEEGRLALDDPVAQHLSGLILAQPHGRMTIRDLLAHSGGLEDRRIGYFADPPEIAEAPAIAWISEIVPRQIRPPSDVISYSNAGYVLLGEIVAQVTGQPFEAYLTEKILSPMGIDRAAFMQRSAETHPSPNLSHVWSSGRYVAIHHPPFPSIHNASGGLAMTAGDIGRFLQGLLRQGQRGDRLGVPASTSLLMQAPAFADRTEFSGRTLGYWTETWAGHQVYYHGGTHFGFHTTMVLVPSLDLGFFVAANSLNGDALMGLPRRVLREVVAPSLRFSSAQADCPVACLGAYAGRFITTHRNETGFDRLGLMSKPAAEISVLEDDVLLLSGLGYSRRFHALGDDLFETPEADLRLGFRRDGMGRVTLAFLNGGTHSFDRQTFWLSPESVMSGMWAALFGTFASALASGMIWRGQRRLAAMPALQAVLWSAVLSAGFVAEDHVRTAGHLAMAGSPDVLFWVVTGLLYLAAGVTICAIVRPLVFPGKVPALRFASGLIAASHFAFAWALTVAWNWSLMSAAFRW